jgi:hypothetical protein
MKLNIICEGTFRLMTVTEIPACTFVRVNPTLWIREDYGGRGPHVCPDQELVKQLEKAFQERS